MAKLGNLIKLFLLIQIVEYCVALPIDDVNFDNSGYDQDITGWIPLPPQMIAPHSYWSQQSSYPANRFYPAYNERIKTWLMSQVPSKRNSELINSLLGLPKNMDAAGK